MTARDAYEHLDEDGSPARGIINGVLFAIPCWALIGLTLWLCL